jgi:hypothetical protein
MDDGLNALWIKLFLFSKTRAESTDLDLALSTDLATCNLAIFPIQSSLTSRLVTPAKVSDMAAQLPGMFRTPVGFVSAKKNLSL